jgi:hypothetical protein
MGKYKLRGRQKMKAINKMAFVVAGASLFGLAAYFTVFINTTQVSTSNAGLYKNMMVGYDITTGEVITQFTWEDGNTIKADVGPDALSVSKEAKVQTGGADNSKGLSPGKTMQPLNFTIPSVKEFNLGGIDVSLDYRKSEQNCNLFTRGSQFNMGIKNGQLAIAFKTKSKDKETFKVNEITRYEIPDDDEFRNYRFIYNPVDGKAELFVNGVAIWSYNTQPDCALEWKDSDPVIVGKDLKGDGTDKVFIDNVIIKATKQISDLPVTLLNFEAAAENNYVMVSWYTASETEIDSFIIEKSGDAKIFTEVGKVKATGGPKKLTAYALIDKSPNTGLAYYRLVPSNKPLKSQTISVIGYKYRGPQGDLKVSDVDVPKETQN